MSVAGVPSDRFLFAGFLPVRRDARRRELQRLSALPTTMVFFESVHRIRDSLCDMRDCLGGDRAAFLAREISKLNEQYIHANLDALCDAIEDGSIPAKGEFVVVIAGSDQPPEREAGLDSEVLLRELLEHMSGKEAVEITCRVTGRPRNEVYREMLALRADD